MPKRIESTEAYKLKKLGITREPGKKPVKEDKIIKFHGKALNMVIMGKIYEKLCQIQNQLDPKGIGAEYLANYLEEIREEGKLTDEIKRKYNISSWKPDKTVTLSGNDVSLEIFGHIYSEMCKVQDLLYPYGKGAKYLAEYFEDIRKNGKLTEEIKRRYKIS